MEPTCIYCGQPIQDGPTARFGEAVVHPACREQIAVARANSVQEQIIEDFKSWSGGFTPDECSEEELRTYAETRRPAGMSEEDYLRFLQDWRPDYLRFLQDWRPAAQPDDAEIARLGQQVRREMWGGLDPMEEIHCGSHTSYDSNCPDCRAVVDQLRNLAKDTPIRMSFNDLAHGARFRYLKDGKPAGQVWIKLQGGQSAGGGWGLIAAYDREMIRHRGWVGQSICCFSDKEAGIYDEVELAEPA